MIPSIDHFSPDTVRIRALRIVYQLPGIHMRGLQRLLGTSFNSTRYNVERLCRSGIIVSQRQSGHVRLYPPGTGDIEKAIYSMLRNETSRSILAALDDSRNGLTNKELSEQIHLAKSTVSENVHRLVNLGLIHFKTSRNTGRVYTVASKLNINEKLSQSGKQVPASVIDRYIDLWDF